MGWSNTVAEPAFGGGSGGSESIKNRLIGLMTSVRTLMRSKFSPFLFDLEWRWAIGKDIGEREEERRRERRRREKGLFERDANTCFLAVPLIGINVTIILYELALG